MRSQSSAQPRKRRGRQARGGFTTVELILVLIIAGVLSAIAFPHFARYMSLRRVVSARDAFALEVARARSLAIQRGDVAVLVIRLAADEVAVMTPDMQSTLHSVDLGADDKRVDIFMTDAPDPFRICYVPRGYAHPSCGEGGALDSVGFATSTDTLWARINAVGQVEQ